METISEAVLLAAFTLPLFFKKLPQITYLVKIELKAPVLFNQKFSSTIFGGKKHIEIKLVVKFDLKF